jgi:hypothetical protein
MTIKTRKVKYGLFLLASAAVLLWTCGTVPNAKDRSEIPVMTRLIGSVPDAEAFHTVFDEDELGCLEDIYALLGNACYWVGEEDSSRLSMLLEMYERPSAYGLEADHLLDMDRAHRAVRSRLTDPLSHPLLIRELGYSLACIHLILAIRDDRRAEYGTLLDFCSDTAFIPLAAAAIRSEDVFAGMAGALPGSMGERLTWIREFVEEEGLEYPGYEIPRYTEDGSAINPAAVLALQDLGLLTPVDSLVDSMAYTHALMTFQQLNGLEIDGVIGSMTASAFRKPHSERYRQLQANLDRARLQAGWIKGEVYIEVNIPEMALRFYREGEALSRHKVIIGKRKDHQTPSFKASINEIVVNPEWTVPYSIATKEILPDQLADPNYMNDHHYMVFNTDKEMVDPQTVAWTELSIYYFPYRIVQEAGSWNALGTVKFLFPNRHQVYIHDTPSRHLFDKTQRDFSHGCIRVERPYELALLILENSSTGVDSAEFFHLVDTAQLYSIPVHPRIPVIVDYGSVRKDAESGRLIFFTDIYGKDEEGF